MTAQIHETLVLDGQETSMAFCPPFPKRHARIVRVPNEQVWKRNPSVFSTACWRHYFGTWEIRNGRLYLVGLRGIYEIIGDEPILADWFSGVIRIPEGDMLHYVHMGFGSVFENELHIKVVRGIVAASRVIDNREKNHNEWLLALRNLPGFENCFPGDRSL